MVKTDYPEIAMNQNTFYCPRANSMSNFQTFGFVELCLKFLLHTPQVSFSLFSPGEMFSQPLNIVWKKSRPEIPFSECLGNEGFDFNYTLRLFNGV
jgi:hypothetical protein